MLLAIACVFAVVCLAGLLSRVSERLGGARRPQFGNEDAKQGLLGDLETEYPKSLANGANGYLNGTSVGSGSQSPGRSGFGIEEAAEEATQDAVGFKVMAADDL